jgi:hypothetical protein
MFTKAVKSESLLRLAIDGLSGSGKTYTALLLAKAFGGRVAVIDTEHGSAKKYADLVDFDVCELSEHSPETYISAIEEATQARYDVLIVDSLSHEWDGKNGVLDLADQVSKRSASKFSAWAEVKPRDRRFMDTLLAVPMHLIATLRVKTEFVVQSEGGRTSVRKVGLAPVQRDGIEHEFDVYARMDLDHSLTVLKSRCPELSGAVFDSPNGEEIVAILRRWLTGPKPQQAQPYLEDAANKEKLKNALIALQVPVRDRNALLGWWATKTYDEIAADVKLIKQNLKRWPPASLGEVLQSLGGPDPTTLEAALGVPSILLWTGELEEAREKLANAQ